MLYRVHDRVKNSHCDKNQAKVGSTLAVFFNFEGFLYGNFLLDAFYSPLALINITLYIAMRLSLLSSDYVPEVLYT